MTIPKFLSVLTFAILLLSFPAFAQQTRFKVLAFYSDKTEPDHVDFARDAIKFLASRAVHEGFTFEATTNWRDLNYERLKTVQLVIWLNESPANPDQRLAFERYMEHGGAWLGFHAAGYNDKDTRWPWFVDFLGGAVFYSNSWPPLPARLTIDDPAHPVTTKIPADFESPANEWYVWQPSPRLNPNVRVLATLGPSNYPIGFKDVLTSGDLPAVWTNTKYKMLYMNMGHGDKIFTSPIQNQLIDNAVNWLGTGAKLSSASFRNERGKIKPNGIRVSQTGVVINSRTGKFYAVNTMHNAVTVLDGEGKLLRTIQVGREPESIAINPDTNRIYVANGGSGTITVIDGSTDKPVTNVAVGDLPYTITVNRTTNKVYVSRTFSDVTVIIDGETNIARTVKAGVGDAVAADSLENSTYLMSYEAPQVTVFGGKDDQFTKIKAPGHLWAMAANPVTKKLYAASAGSASVVVIDGKSHATKLVKTGEIPCAIAVDSSSGKVFIANYASNTVSVLDGVNDSVLATVGVSPNPQAITVDSRDHKVYVASTRVGIVTIFDGINYSVIGRVNTGNAPFAIAVNSETHEAVALGLKGDVKVIDGTTLMPAETRAVP